MASRLIKPNTLYHMAVRVFLSHSFSLWYDWFLFHFFISSVSEYLMSHRLLHFWLLRWSQLYLFLCYFKEINPPISEWDLVWKVFFSLYFAACCCFSCSEHQNWLFFFSVLVQCLYFLKIKWIKCEFNLCNLWTIFKITMPIWHFVINLLMHHSTNLLVLLLVGLVLALLCYFMWVLPELTTLWRRGWAVEDFSCGCNLQLHF